MLAFLSDAEALVAETQHLAAARRNPVTLSRVFLLYRMHRASARIVRGLFYLSVHADGGCRPCSGGPSVAASGTSGLDGQRSGGDADRARG
jgi:hypothetical protein